MGVKERQEREREAVPGRSWTPRATCSSPRAITTSRSARSPSGSNTARLRSTAISRARTTSSSRSPKRASACCSRPCGRAVDEPAIRSSSIRAGVLAGLRVQQVAPRVLRADVPRSHRSRGSARTGSASASSARCRRSSDALIQRAIDAGQFPAGSQPDAVFRILLTAVHGAAVMRLCDRLAPGEDADALARDTLEAALTGLRAGFPDHVSVTPAARIVRRNSSEARDHDTSVVPLCSRSAGTRSSLGVAQRLPAADVSTETAPTPQAADPLAVSTAAVESRPIDRYLRVTGSLMADEQAEVSAETAGPRRSRRRSSAARASQQGALLARISATETSAQLQEAEANAAQIEARLGLAAGQPFDPMRVPDVMNAKASLDLRRGGVQPHPLAARSEGRLAERVRSAPHAGRGGAPAVSGGAELGRAVVPLARSRARPHRAGAQGGRRHRRPRAVRRARRRARRQRRRLRHARRARRHGRPRRSAARRADRAGAVGVARSRSASRCGSRSTPIPARSSTATIRFVSPGAARRSARADGRSDRGRTPTAG